MTKERSEGGGTEPWLARERRALEILAAALQAPGERRSGLVASLCADDQRLRSRVERLLMHDRDADESLGTPASWPGLPRAGSCAGPAPDAAGSEPSDAPLLAPGTCLGDYVVEGYLAGGGHGEVYRARQRSLGRRVALKVMPARRVSRADRERFLRGARVIGRIHHPHLAEVYGCGEDAERRLLYYSMRFVEGVTLHALLAELAGGGGAPTGRTRAVLARFLEVAEALGELHANGLVHRDVKPMNILLESPASGSPWDGRAVLVDYELLRRWDSEQARWTRWVSPAYAAPEQLRAEAVDARVDVFGLGLCMHDVLSARLPEHRARGTEQGLELLGELVPRIDPDLEALVDRAVSPDPGRRHPDGATLARDIAAWLRGDPLDATRVSRRERAGRWLRRNPGQVARWGVRAAAVLAVLGVLAGALVPTWHVLAGAHSVRRAWAEGDLLAIEGGLVQVPAWLDRWLFEGPIHELVQEVRDPERPSPGASVAGRRNEEGAPLLLAARYLGRDGLEAHPDLARFFEWALRSKALASDAIRLLGLLYLECPDTEPSAVDSSSALRERLTASLDDERIPVSARLFALTALGGCGTDATIAPVLAWMEDDGLSSESPGPEHVRLALCCLGMLVRRSEPCGYLDGLLARDLDDLLSRASAAALRALEKPGPDLGTAAALEDLFTTIIYACRTAGRELPRVPAPLLSGRPFLSYRAALRDPELARELMDVQRLRSLVEQRDGRSFVQELGQVVGLFGDAALAVGVRELLPELAHHDPAYVRWFDERFALGHGSAPEVYRGIPETWLPDEPSRLGSFFRQSQLPSEPVATEHGGDPGGQVLATWRFHGGRARTEALARGIELRCGDLEGDALDPADGWLCLAAFGQSEVRLRFSSLPRLRAMPSLYLRFQKGCRAQLPFGGEAFIRIGLDGRCWRATW